MDDPATRSFTCDETLTFHTTQRPITTLTLDGAGLEVQSVTDADNKPLDWRCDDQTMTVRWPRELAADDNFGVKIHYSCSRPKSNKTSASPGELFTTLE